jgi:hypothetical protein
MSAQTELREEVLAALYAEFDRRDRKSRLVWVMSDEWWRDIRSIFLDPTVFLIFPRSADYQLLGIPVDIRDDAGFPKLRPA